MHIDYTFHFWTALSQGLALLGLGTFLYKAYRAIREMVNATLSILHEHHEMYGWYREQIKGKV